MDYMFIVTFIEEILDLIKLIKYKPYRMVILVFVLLITASIGIVLFSFGGMFFFSTVLGWYIKIPIALLLIVAGLQIFFALYVYIVRKDKKRH